MLLMSMPSRLLAPALATWLVAAIASAHADTERYTVVIGDNRGARDEQSLRYAEGDAQRFADLLADIGGVPSENQIVLRGKSAGLPAPPAGARHRRTPARRGKMKAIRVRADGLARCSMTPRCARAPGQSHCRGRICLQ